MHGTHDRYQLRPKAVGCMPWIDSPASTYIALWPFVAGLAVTA